MESFDYGINLHFCRWVNTHPELCHLILSTDEVHFTHNQVKNITYLVCIAPSWNNYVIRILNKHVVKCQF
jgi:hypothetical protein